MIIYYILSLLVIGFLVFPFMENLLALFFTEKMEEKPEMSTNADFACIITAYQNVAITKALVESLLQQTYSKFVIYLVADDCKLDNWNLTHTQLRVLQPIPALNLKAKSIIYAVEHFQRAHNYVVIFDADNVAHPKFLEEINRYVLHGHEAIQGQRTAKNLDTTYACVDAIGEFYKNYVERYLPFRLGSSSVISGSGMAIETELYKSYLYGPEIQQGKDKWKKMLQEDKILQNHILLKNQRIVFAREAIVYDEKVNTGQAVETQRSRWLYSYFQNIPNARKILWEGIKNGSFNQLWFGIITIAPPLFIQVFLALGLGFLGLWIAPLWSLGLLAALLIFAGNIFLVLYLSRVPRVVWRSLKGVPLFVFRQVLALLKMKNPNKNFKHSDHHQYISIDEIMNNNS